MRKTALGLVLIFLGYMLAWTSIHDQTPWQPISEALGGAAA